MITTRFNMKKEMQQVKAAALQGGYDYSAHLLLAVIHIEEYINILEQIINIYNYEEYPEYLEDSITELFENNPYIKDMR